jgi:DNA repair protein RadC
MANRGGKQKTQTPKTKTKGLIKVETIYEVVKIKQVLSEITNPLLETKISSPDSALELARHFIGDEDREVFLVMCLNTKNQITAVHRCHIGAIDACIVHPREVYKSCILNNSKSLIVAHNHPSQDISPSTEDFKVTDRLKSAGDILGIELLDHLIVNDKGDYYSFREKGRL